jgi:hypothetical protein
MGKTTHELARGMQTTENIWQNLEMVLTIPKTTNSEFSSPDQEFPCSTFHKR